jgi:diguanylate cyclase (GGDEF)-like protein/PAS domain S-box-containing protein
LAKALEGPLAQTLALGQAVARLAVSEQQFRGIAEATGDGIVATDESGRIFYLNPAAERMFAASIDDLRGASLRHLCPLDQGGPDARQTFGLRADGDQSPVEVHTHRCEDRFSGAHDIHVLRDLSDRYACVQLNDVANRDPLTNLWNRRRFDEELRQRLSEARRYETAGALVLLDLDNFKAVNDTSGHLAGDRVLRIVAARLIALTRSSDLVARLGGDEFAVLLPQVNEDGAKRCAQRILETLAPTSPADREENGPVVECSIGIALFPTHGTEPDALFELADHALYQAKLEGRNRATMYCPTVAKPATKSGIHLSGTSGTNVLPSAPLPRSHLAEE